MQQQNVALVYQENVYRLQGEEYLIRIACINLIGSYADKLVHMDYVKQEMEDLD